MHCRSNGSKNPIFLKKSNKLVQFLIMTSLGNAPTMYRQISGKHCSGFGKDDYTSHGGISTTECKAKCDQDERCVVYASKENEWCTTYEKCIVTGTQWGGSFSHKVRPYAQISASIALALEMTITSHGISTAEARQSATKTSGALSKPERKRMVYHV